LSAEDVFAVEDDIVTGTSIKAVGETLGGLLSNIISKPLTIVN
jgi:hypothetical protein